MKKTRKRVLVMLSVLILALVVMIGGLRILESTVLLPRQEEQPVVSKTITQNGVDYFPRQDITTLLVMGIDETGPVKDSGSYRNTGESDVVMLMIFDEKNESYSILTLNRDTMLKMPVLGLGGKQAGTFYGQLALSHTYGSGLADSCENTRNTVSDFLSGIEIDYYVAMNMDAIGILNDAVGGVTVTVVDDFSDVDPSIKMGQFTLLGDQAIHYVRTRKDVSDQKNVTRMQRQKEYVESFLEAFRECAQADSNFLLSVFEEVSPYIVTDCSANTLSGIMSRYSGYALGDVHVPEGNNIIGEQFYEFYVDETALDEMILDLCYREK